MTMPSAGPISIGQARAEMGLGGTVNAGHSALSQLAGVSPGQTFAWSYWYGKSKPLPYQKAITFKYTVDWELYVYFNLRTGGFGLHSWGERGADPRTTFELVTNWIGSVPGISGNITASLGAPRQRTMTVTTGNPETGESTQTYPMRMIDGLSIYQHPRPENDWTLIVYLYDQAGYSSGGGEVDVYVGS